MIRFLFLTLIIYINPANSSVYVMSEGSDLIGEIQYTISRIGETIDKAGRRFNVGYYEMVHANPRVDAVHPLGSGTRLVIPSQFILPNVTRAGIVINLAEYRLYYFLPDENVVLTFPVGIGKEGWHTPLGVTKITAKVANPVWHPTANIRVAAEEAGVLLPEEFPAGSNNPLGKHVLRLGWPTFLIHGTNRRDGVGARVSAGCIRMLPEDIEYLFQHVKVGTQVRIINEPVKIGQDGGEKFIQLYPLLKEQSAMSLDAIFRKKIRGIDANNRIVKQELSYPSGLVKQIS